MPKKMFWTEALFAWLPIDRKKLRDQIIVRLLFLFLLWLIGLVAFAIDGLGAEYVSNMQLYVALFGTGFIVLFGSYMIQASLASTVLSLRPLLKLDDSQFKKFLGKIELYSFNFVPVLVVTLLFTVFLPGSRITLAQLEGLFRSLHAAWGVVFVLFMNLLTATGIWMGVSIWLAVFLVSRQPLQVELSARSAAKFRGLTNLAFGFALFYFLAIVIGLIIPLSSTPIVSLVDLVMSPAFLYIVIGVLAVVLPFYNIHRTLTALKKQELRKIDEEFEEVERELGEVLKQPAAESRGQSAALMNRLFRLQIKERRVKAAKEWPIDIRFLSKVVGLIAAAVIARILAEIINRLGS